MKEIPLTQGQYALVDDEDYEWLSRWKWSAVRTRHTYYAVRNERVRDIGVPKSRRKLIMMHREIANAKYGMDIDHWNRNGLDNQKRNLRECPHADNMKNQKVSDANKTGYKGVYWNKKNRKYISNITIGGKVIYLGSFETAREAAVAYDKKALEEYGEYARVNIPTF